MEKEFAPEARQMNALLYTMRNLYNKGVLTTWEFREMLSAADAWAKERNLVLDYNEERIYKIDKTEEKI